MNPIEEKALQAADDLLAAAKAHIAVAEAMIGNVRKLYTHPISQQELDDPLSKEMTGNVVPMRRA